MPRASYRVLANFFAHHLNFTPTQGDIASFERDLAVVSPSLMEASLIELSKGKGRQPAGAGQWRAAIYGIYNRKVAEQAQLFPAFHCFETAFRSRVAVSLEEHYRISAWWGPFALAIMGGGDGRHIARIGVIDPVSTERRRAIRLLTQEFIDHSIDPMLFQDGYELLGNSTLGQLKRLLESHWDLFIPLFTRNGQTLTLSNFLTKFQRVRDARNAVYHHQSFGGMTDAYETAADLLSYIGFSLPKVHKLIAATRCAAPPYF